MKLNITLAFLFCASFAFAQSYFEVIPEPTFQKPYDASESETILYYYLHNKADTAAHYKWTRQQLCDLPPNWTNAVCDCQVCYTPPTWRKPNSALIEPGQCLGSFHYYFAAGAAYGSHSSKVTFYNPLDSLNSTTSAIFSIENGCVTGTGEQSITTSYIYPVPCNTELFIETNTKTIAGLQLIDASGRVVEDLRDIPSGSLRLDMEHRQNGVYYVRMLYGSQSVQVTKVIKI